MDKTDQNIVHEFRSIQGQVNALMASFPSGTFAPPLLSVLPRQHKSRVASEWDRVDKYQGQKRQFRYQEEDKVSRHMMLMNRMKASVGQVRQLLGIQSQTRNQQFSRSQFQLERFSQSRDAALYPRKYRHQQYQSAASSLQQPPQRTSRAVTKPQSKLVDTATQYEPPRSFIQQIQQPRQQRKGQNAVVQKYKELVRMRREGVKADRSRMVDIKKAVNILSEI